MADKLLALAGDIRAALGDDPSLTVGELAVQLDAIPSDVSTVLDEYRVQSDRIVHVGPGAGGGWVIPS